MKKLITWIPVAGWFFTDEISTPLFLYQCVCCLVVIIYSWSIILSNCGC